MKYRQVTFYNTAEKEPRMMVEFIWYVNGRKMSPAQILPVTLGDADSLALWIRNWIVKAETPDGRTIESAK